ncbi:putative leucine-rich repeat-containing protein DDB_G0290503 [Eleginops maclovinus]|uniref:putative leucine-rich repeat-containing protein DDB_G0290503 n=1 Tax=Eleginops maclovinus TaxID=56733 RepID=UPI00307FFE0B
MKGGSTSEPIVELIGLHTQAKMEKDETEANINEMEEDFKKENTSLRRELSIAQSYIDHMKEENAKLTQNQVRTSEVLNDLMGLQTKAKTEKEEMEAKLNKIEEDFKEENTSLRMELTDGQSYIDHMKEEKTKLTQNQVSTSEVFDELMGLETQAKMEKEEMEAKINEIEEDFKEENTTLKTELTDAQSYIDHMKEENARLTMKDVSTSEAFEELTGLQTQAKMEKEVMEAKINEIEEDSKEVKTSLRMELLDAQSNIDHQKKENAKLTMKDVSTSEAFEELTGLQTQAKMEKEEMEDKITEMEEDFKKEKTTLGTELSVAQSYIDHMKEENARLTQNQVSTSEVLNDLMGLQTKAKTEKEEMEAKLNKIEEDFKEENTSLRMELTDGQSYIDHMKEEKAKLTQNQVSTSEIFDELMGLETQAKMEKEEMEAKITEMEEDFKKEKTTLGTELSVAQSYIDHMKEENAKLTQNQVSTSEVLNELMGLETQAKTEKEEMEAKINEIEEDFKEENTTLRTELTDAQSYIDHMKEENARLTMKDVSTSEAFEELTGLQTQAKMEKEVMEAKINEIEEDFKEVKTSLRMELLDAQSNIDHQKKENAKLTMKDVSTSEAFEELTGLQTQAKMEKEEMEAKITEMEEDFKKEKTTLGTELSVAQSYIDHMKEENAKLTQNQVSTSEVLDELMGLETQAKTEKEEMEAKINEIEEDFKEENTTLRTELTDAQSYIDHMKEENARLTMKDVSTSEAFEELTGLQTQAKMEKEVMEAKINEIEEDFKEVKTSLRMELLDAQSNIDHQKKENAKLTMKDVSTSEAFEELTGLQTQAKMEKEEMEDKITEMEEDFKKEKTTLGTELSVAQSYIDHMKEENAILTQNQVSTSEVLDELMGLETQAKTEKEEMEAKINEIEEDFKEEKTSLRMELSDAQSHIDHMKEGNARLTMKDVSTTEALEELMGLQTHSKTEKELMEVKINEMEEDFKKKKASLTAELSDAQSHIDHMTEENARLTQNQVSTSEVFEEIMGQEVSTSQDLEELQNIQTQVKKEKHEMEAKMNETEEDFKKEKTTLGTELSVAQSYIDHMKEENAKLTQNQVSTSEVLDELMGLETQAKTEKEEMEAKINEIEEDFKEENTTLRTELTDAQSYIDHMKEENARLTMKDVSTSEAFEELTGLQTQAKMEKEVMEAKINEIEEDFKEVKTSLRMELLDTQSNIDHQKKENAKLTMKDVSTSEAFEELTGLQTQAKMEKEEMEDKITEMEEDFKKEKTTLGTELSVAQSYIDHMKEENAILTQNQVSTSEVLDELMGLETQAKTEKEEMEAKINEIEEDFKEEKTSLRMELSDAQSHIDHMKEGNARLTMKDVSTTEALEELMGLQTHSKTEKELMEVKINEMEEDFKKKKASLTAELSDAQSHIDHMTEENARLTQNQVSTSEVFEEIMGQEVSTSQDLEELQNIQTQVKKEKHEMEAKMNETEEDFKKEKTTLGTELSVAQSYIDHMKEENAKLTMKDVSTSEVLDELMGLETQAKTEKEEMEAKINEIEEDFKEENTSLRTELSVSESHNQHLNKENARLTQNQVSTSEALEELMGLQTKATASQRQTLNLLSQEDLELSQSKKCFERKYQAVEETHEKELTEKENSCQIRVAEMVSKDEMDKMFLQREAEERPRTSAVEEEIQRLIRVKRQLQMPTSRKQKKKWWKRRLHLRRQLRRARATTSNRLLPFFLDQRSGPSYDTVKITMKGGSTSKPLVELIGLPTQAKTEKEETEANINETEEDFKKEKTSLRMELSVAQSHIDHMKEENARLTMKDVSTFEALEELMSLQTQAKVEKEEMEAKITEMEEHFKKEKTTLRTELSIAQSHIALMTEENARLTQNQVSTSEALNELMGLETQAKTEKEEMEAKINEIEEDVKKEKTSLSMELSVSQSHNQNLNKENARLTPKEICTSESLEELMGLQTQATSSERETLNLLCQKDLELSESKKSFESKYVALEETYKKELTEKENSCQRRLAEMVSKNELEKMLLQREAEDRCRTSALEEEIQKLIREKKQPQTLTSRKQEKKWWKRRLHLRRQLRRARATTSNRLLPIFLGQSSGPSYETVTVTMKGGSTCEPIVELIGLHTQAKMENEEVETKINQMEDDFKKEKASLRTELSAAQSQIDHLKEENARLTQKHVSTSEVFEELMGLQTQTKKEKDTMEAKINEMEEDFKKEKTSLRMELSVAQSHIDHLNKENARLTQKQVTTSESLKELMGLQTQLTSSQRQTLNLLIEKDLELCESKKRFESKYQALEETYKKELTEKENSCQRRVAEMVSKDEVEKMLLQREAEDKRRTSALEEEIQRLIREKKQLQV